jgi:hypothetical protein
MNERACGCTSRTRHPGRGSYRVPVAIIEDEPELGLQRYCRGCEMWWPADEEFYYRAPDGSWYARCRACWREYNRQWFAAHGEPVRERRLLAHRPDAVRFVAVIGWLERVLITEAADEYLERRRS